jgi:hypothetical protein
MDAEQFERVFEEQVKRCTDLLLVKAREYATEDRLHNFKRAAALKGETPRQALVGIMVKHTVSIFDMGLSDKHFTPAQWDEKITDHMNYLFLLRAIAAEEEMEKTTVAAEGPYSGEHYS